MVVVIPRLDFNLPPDSMRLSSNIGNLLHKTLHIFRHRPVHLCSQDLGRRQHLETSKNQESYASFAGAAQQVFRPCLYSWSLAFDALVFPHSSSRARRLYAAHSETNPPLARKPCPDYCRDYALA